MSSSQTPPKINVSSYAAMKKEKIIYKLRHVIDMISKVESIAILHGKDPNSAVERTIQYIETRIFDDIVEQYNDLKKEIAKNSPQENHIYETRLLIDPDLLAPSIIPSQIAFDERPIFPIRLFTTNKDTQEIIPAVCKASSRVKAMEDPKFEDTIGSLLQSYTDHHLPTMLYDNPFSVFE